MPDPIVTKRGIRGAGTVIADKIVVDMEDTIHLLDPNATPFTLLMSKLGKETIHNPEYNWLEDDFVPLTSQTSAEALENATTIVVDDPTYFRVNDIIIAPSVTNADNMLVTAIDDDTDTLTVVRRIGNEETAPLIPAETEIVRQGNAFPEGARARDILSTNEVPMENYAQIFKHTFGVTETLNATKTYGGSDLGWQRKKAGIEQAIEMERTYWFGRKGKRIGENGHTQRFMDGMLSFIKTNVQSLGDAWSLADFNGWLSDCFKHGSETKYVFCAEALINQISNEAADLVRLKQSDKTFGIAITEYVTPAGKKVYLINNNRVFDVAPYNQMAVCIDLAKVKMTSLRPMVLKTNVQKNDEDSQKDMYIGEQGLKVMNEKVHGILEDISLTVGSE